MSNSMAQSASLPNRSSEVPCKICGRCKCTMRQSLKSMQYMAESRYQTHSPFNCSGTTAAKMFASMEKLQYIISRTHTQSPRLTAHQVQVQVQVQRRRGDSPLDCLHHLLSPVMSMILLLLPPLPPSLRLPLRPS